MYLADNHTGPVMKIVATRQPPSGPGFSAEEVAEADQMEVYATSFTDPGPDYCEFVLFKSGKELRRKRVNGY